MINLQKVYVLMNEPKLFKSRSGVRGLMRARTRRVRHTHRFLARELSFPAHSALGGVRLLFDSENAVL